MALRPLSGLDAGFLYLETPEQPMHVASCTVYDPPADLDGSFADRVREHLRQRLHLAPLLHHKLASMPLELGHPVWTQAGEPDLAWHVRGERLKRPGSMRQLEARIAELHAMPLDRTRPLWQCTVFDGLAKGKVAMYFKVHHAALDGQAGVQLTQAMMDLGPEPRVVSAPHLARVHSPGRRKLLGALFSNSAAQYVKLVRSVPEVARAVAGHAREIGSRLADPSTLGQKLLAPKTRFNGQISAQRAFATLSLPLTRAKAISVACGVSINDLVLATVSGALVRYLKRHQALPRRSLVAAVPFSLRGGDLAAAGNQVTMLPATLATHRRDARSRLAAIHTAMNALKATTGALKGLIPTDFPSLGAPWLLGGLTKLFERTHLADRVPLPANLVISNVPGPPMPLYLAGARMRAYFPVSIIVHGLALNLTVHSYEDALDLGVVACPDQVPDLADLIDDLRAAFDELSEVAATTLAPRSAPTANKAAQRRSSARPSAVAKAARRRSRS